VLTLLDRYIAREILLNLLGVQIVLFLILVSNQLLRVLSDVSAGSLPADAVAAVLGSFGLKIFVRLLPVSFYLGIILAMGRLYRDSEVVVMRACGVNDWDLLKPISVVAVPLMAILGLSSLYLVPWTIRVTESVTDSAAVEVQLEGVRPGRFTVAGDGRYTLFVENIVEDGRVLDDVFLESRDGTRPGVERAERGRQIQDTGTGDRFLVLGPGVRYEGAPGQAQMRITEYREHGVLVRKREPVINLDRISGKTTAALLKSIRRGDLVELQWRISLPFAIVVLGLLALPLSRVSPRQGRFGKIAVALLVYIVFMNLAGVNRAWMEKGLMGIFPGFWWIYLLGVILAMVLLAWQNRWFERWRYRETLGA
jgi:lipopolysaccharide export system permease protein